MTIRARWRRAAAAVATTMAVATAEGCAGAPWFLGDTLEGHPSIPNRSRAETVADQRRNLSRAHAAGETVLELVFFEALEARGALSAAERQRFAQLLRERAKDWVVLRRPLALVQDLRHLVELEPAWRRQLHVPLRNAARAAGDAWLAIGENGRAEDEYRQAERAGAPGMLVRLRAVWGASPDDSETEVLAQALAELPERVLAPFTSAYLRSGGSDPRLLQRALRAARVYTPGVLVTRIESVPTAALPPPTTPTPAAEEPASYPKGPDVPPTVAVPAAEKSPKLVEPGPYDYLYRGPSLARSLLPLLDAFPSLADPSPRARAWAERLVAEDPTSPDSLEAAALIDARGGRPDAAARKLTDLVFYSADRADGYMRAARVWERAAEGRRACLAWEKQRASDQ